jgi:hypothetical protein
MQVPHTMKPFLPFTVQSAEQDRADSLNISWAARSVNLYSSMNRAAASSMSALPQTPHSLPMRSGYGRHVMSSVELCPRAATRSKQLRGTGDGAGSPEMVPARRPGRLVGLAVLAGLVCVPAGARSGLLRPLDAGFPASRNRDHAKPAAGWPPRDASDSWGRRQWHGARRNRDTLYVDNRRIPSRTLMRAIIDLTSSNPESR